MKFDNIDQNKKDSTVEDNELKTNNDLDVKESKVEVDGNLEELKIQNSKLKKELENKNNEFGDLKRKYENFISSMKLEQQSETDDLIKRYSQQIKESKDKNIFDISKKFFPILQDVVHAQKHNKKFEDDANVANILTSINMIKNKLIEILNGNGIEVIFPNIGDKFDYAIHDAIGFQKSEDEAMKDKIFEVLSPGLRISKINRVEPAKVVVWT